MAFSETRMLRSLLQTGWFLVKHNLTSFLSASELQRLSVVVDIKSDLLVRLIHYAERTPHLGEAILRTLQIHNKGFQHTHTSTAARPAVCPYVCLFVCPSLCRTK